MAHAQSQTNPQGVETCEVCHGAAGEGNGEVVQRGFPAPPSYHIDRLRNAPIGHFYDVITNGYGVMSSYAAAIEPTDRWAIAAYIRALQLSRNASIDDVPPDERRLLKGDGSIPGSTAGRAGGE